MKAAVACGVAAVLLAACAAPLGSKSVAGSEASGVPAPSGFLNAGPVVSLTHSEQFRGGERLEPPTTGQAPAITAAAAYAKCEPGFCGVTHPPTVDLADVTLPNAYTSGGGQGAVAGRLAYVFTWEGEPCAGNGPVSVDGVCDMWFIVDATTGDVLYNLMAGTAYTLPPELRGGNARPQDRHSPTPGVLV